jgi:hypothetical protein
VKSQVGAVTVIMVRAAREYLCCKTSKRLANNIPKVRSVYRKKLRFIGADAYP